MKFLKSLLVVVVERLKKTGRGGDGRFVTVCRVTGLPHVHIGYMLRRHSINVCHDNFSNIT